MGSAQTLTSRSVRSLGWEIVARAGEQVVTLLSTAILARLVGPAAYGTMGMAALFINFASTFSQMGIPAAVVQKAELDPDILSSLFWLNMFMGIGLSLALIIVSPAAGRFFHEPLVSSLLSVLAWTFAIAALGNIQHALFYREMKLRKPALAQCASSAVAFAAATFFALRGAGVWSLVISTLTCRVMDTVLMWTLHPWRPKLRLRWAHFRSVAGFGASLSGFSIVNYFSRNGDNLIVGRFLGPAALGYYQNAYSLMYYPQQFVTSLVSNVALASMSKVQHETERFRSGILKLSALIAAVLFPAMTGLMLVSDLLIRVVLGPKWSASATVLSILAFAGLLQAAGGCTGPIFLSKGEPQRLFRWSWITGATNVIAFLVGVHWGIQGVATGFVLATAALIPPLLGSALRLADTGWPAYGRAAGPFLAASAGMAAFVIAVRWALSAAGIEAAPLLLIVCVVAGMISYAALLLLAWPGILRDLMGAALSTDVPVLRKAAGRIVSWREPRRQSC